MKKKRLIVLLFYCFIASLLVLLSASPVEAAMSQEFQEAVEQFEQGGPITKEVFDKETAENILNIAILGVGGSGAGGGGGEVGQRRDGAFAIVANLTGTLYNTQPASSVEYLADLGNNLGLVPTAYAQGMGWHAFSPVLNLWKTFRNIAYLVFIIIFVVIGFMIMFRKKIDPQTVISIQNALPKIVVTLILITFSYAIAGFIIDLGQLTTRIIGNTLRETKLIAFSLTGSEAESKAILEKLLSADVFTLVNPLRNVEDLVRYISEVEVGPVAIWGIGSLTVRAIFWIAGFFIMFKIFFILVGPYIAIVLSIIFAPFQLLLGAIPGSQGGLGSWLKNLLANVLVFPVTFAMLALAAVFKGGADTVLYKTCASPPPPSFLIGGQSAPWCPGQESVQVFWFPTTIGNWGAAAGQIIGFGILFTIPKVVEMVQGVFEIKPTPWGAAAGEEIRGGAARIPMVGKLFGGR